MGWNIACVILAILLIAGAVVFGRISVQGLKNYDPASDPREVKLRCILTLVIEAVAILLGVWLLCANAPKLVNHFTANQTQQSVDDGATSSSKGADAEKKKGTDNADADSAKAAEEGWHLPAMSHGQTCVLLSVLGLLTLLFVILYGWKGRRGRKKNAIQALATILAAALLVSNTPGAYTHLFQQKEQKTDKPESNSGQTSEDIAQLFDDGKLPPDAFNANLPEEDLLKAMKKLMKDENFTWEKYQNNYSQDLFPSNYDKRKSRSKKAMQKWYGSSKKQGFSDPVWYPADDLIKVVKSGKWEKMSAEEKEKFINKILRQTYKQVLTSPRYAEQFMEFFYVLAKGYPEIVSRNNPWLPDFKALCKQANDSKNIVKDVNGNQIVAGISVFFEPVTDDSNKKVLKKETVMAAARLCLMFNEFIPAKNVIQDPTSLINWHLAFGKDAQTFKVTKLTKKSQQEDEPAIIFIYYYKGHIAMKVGLNIFDRRLEIFPLTKKAKKEPPIRKVNAPSRIPGPKKVPSPRTQPGPQNQPDPDNKPSPGTKATPKPTPKPTEKPKVTPKPTTKPSDPPKATATPKPTVKPSDPPKVTPAPTPKKKDPVDRPTGTKVPDGPSKKTPAPQDTKPPKVGYKPVPKQPEKKPDPKPTQKPGASEANGSSSGSGKTEPIPVHKDTTATVTGPDGSTTTNTSDGKPNSKVPAPKD